jgi:hypothetical protein
VDAWGRELIFDGRRIEVRSVGPDGLDGTADDLRSDIPD